MSGRASSHGAGPRWGTRELVLMALMTGLGTLLSQFLIIPVGPAKVQPVQALVNVVGAVLYGPWGAVWVAAAISTLRNALGTGTLLAFPGSLFGAALAGAAWRRTRRLLPTALGELVGTGLIGALVAYPMVLLILRKPAGALALVAAFTPPSAVGAFLGLLVAGVLRRAGLVPGGPAGPEAGLPGAAARKTADPNDPNAREGRNPTR
ncbi:MAG: energy coupling factor transporter S component ThiW [Bacillota bacterium]|nr:energy coupling factor transporter S component ThiW [Bacillota bacterium]